jgi:predicted amidohydrolase
VRVAAVQLTVTADRDENLESAGQLVDRAADLGARLVALPELFNLLGPAEVMRAGGEDLDGLSLSWAAAKAREHRFWLLAGSISERVGDGERNYNTSCLFSPEGERVALYRKIHLFDNDVSGAAFRESTTVVAGDEVVTAELDERCVGLSTCYDLRFPELFRILALRGALVVLLPSAFTAATGSAHWEPLLRARAIENQLFVIAPNQVGETPVGIPMWGHSMIIDPWGVPIAVADGGPGVIVADLDFEALRRIRADLPALANRRPEVYGPALLPHGVC